MHTCTVCVFCLQSAARDKGDCVHEQLLWNRSGCTDRLQVSQCQGKEPDKVSHSSTSSYPGWHIWQSRKHVDTSPDFRVCNVHVHQMAFGEAKLVDFSLQVSQQSCNNSILRGDGMEWEILWSDIPPVGNPSSIMDATVTLCSMACVKWNMIALTSMCQPMYLHLRLDWESMMW